MLLPVRCFTCGKVFGNIWDWFVENRGEAPLFLKTGWALDQLKIKRYCCRRMMMTHVDLIDWLLNHSRRDRATEREMQEPKIEQRFARRQNVTLS